MTFTPSVSPASAKPVSPLLYPTLLIAGICVIIASLLGLAAMTGLLPARSQASSQAADARPAVARCADCGVVESVRAIETGGESAGAGTGTGAGTAAHAGRDPEKRAGKKIGYEIRVRMDDNSYRTLHAGEAGVGVGQRVRIRDGRLAPV